MLSDEVIEKVEERLVERIENLNTYILKKIARTIKEIGKLTPTQAHQLIQILQYGGDYERIITKIVEITNLNAKEIKKIFNDIAKEDYKFTEQFYKYRNKRYIKWEDNEILRNQVNAIAYQTIEDYMNISNTRGIGFTITDDKGNIIFKEISKAYQDTVDEAILSVSQGKTTFEEEMARAMQKLGSSGLKYVDYSTGRTRRLDSALRMNISDGLRQLHMQNQQLFAQQFDSDGVEITVVNNPAPDHAEVQGRVFRNSEFAKFQNDEESKDINGKVFAPEHDGRDRRSIGEYNCRHRIFPIVVGVNKPRYTEEELQKIIDRSNEEFEFEGKKYNRYEGEQLQRKIETSIRKWKDIQIMGKESGNEKLTQKAQKKINQLTSKYYELSKVSGLPTKLERLQVDGYRQIKLTDNSPLKQK